MRFPDTSLKGLAYVVLGSITAGIVNTALRTWISPNPASFAQFAVAAGSALIGFAIIMVPIAIQSYRKSAQNDTESQATT